MTTPNKYSEVPNALAEVVSANSSSESVGKEMKHIVQNSYGYWAETLYDKAFINWGLFDKKLLKAYHEQNFSFSSICPHQDINSQLLIFNLIYPLIKRRFFGKKLLEIGCANGIGTRCCSALLKTEYSVGLDLVNGFVKNATKNFQQFEQLTFLQGDAENLPFANNSFDIITNLESSHLYPNLEQFFSEVQRVLSPGGYFCYADIFFTEKKQDDRIEQYVTLNPNLKMIISKDITRSVQRSIHDRLIKNENRFLEHAHKILEKDNFITELSWLANAKGLAFMPWWWIRFKSNQLKSIAQAARASKYWGKKKFFYYLVQKV